MTNKTPRRPENLHKAYHAHIYFDADTIEQGRALATEASQLFKVQMGRVHAVPVGPHPIGSCQLAFSAGEFDKLIPWLDAHRAGLDIFVHALTGNDLADHTTYAYWLGNEWPLKIEMFGPGAKGD
ncbi:MAG TPA: DOPA 4,5-dioxygenase family protein [Ramlibacter sp.]|nr:DOPA 4,5-dioxygenase family protein [Ramlibacter sp.]